MEEGVPHLDSWCPLDSAMGRGRDPLWNYNDSATLCIGRRSGEGLSLSHIGVLGVNGGLTITEVSRPRQAHQNGMQYTPWGLVGQLKSGRDCGHLESGRDWKCKAWGRKRGREVSEILKARRRSRSPRSACIVCLMAMTAGDARKRRAAHSSTCSI